MQTRLHTTLLMVLTCFTFTGMRATHIVGGELNYKNLGANKYEIRLTVYRDCYVGVPPFDSPAYVGIFDSNNNLLQTLLMPFRGLDTLQPAINDPCTIPPLDFCYEVTTYIDTINLPPRAGGYQISYQRCCRNQNILNIINPECVGATYYATIPGPEVVAVNSNPVFKFWPPPFICVNKPWVFDHSAIDADGDSLVYELFMPYDGLTASCPVIINPTPSPAGTSCPNAIASCPPVPVSPPFSPIVWRAPYNTTNMLGGVPMQINSSTGRVTATPNSLGYFVIGIKVKEYRNGVFLSETKRDFQLIVKACPQVVVAAAQAPQTICETTTVSFTNNSTGSSGLGFNWYFGDPTTLADTSHATNPTYGYPGTGSYSVTMVAYVSSKPACNDTITTVVSISKSFKASFTFTTIPCSENLVLFTANAENPPGTSTDWHWNFGDGDTSNVQNTQHYYTGSGNFPVTLVASIPNSINCSDTLSAQTINVVTNPEMYIPNTFTPNGDGYNDLFKVRGPDFAVFYFAVYNRWGQLLFETTDATQGWDGMFKGKMADPGVFGYYVKAKCSDASEEIFRKGNVTLIR
jgi:gliding motility-associated-like protein